MPLTPSYSIYTEHGLNLMVQDSLNKQWIDAVGYEYIASLDLAEPFEMQFFGEGPPQSIPDRSFILGKTFAWSDWQKTK